MSFTAQEEALTQSDFEISFFWREELKDQQEGRKTLEKFEEKERVKGARVSRAEGQVQRAKQFKVSRAKQFNSQPFPFCFESDQRLVAFCAIDVLSLWSLLDLSLTGLNPRFQDETKKIIVVVLFSHLSGF